MCHRIDLKSVAGMHQLNVITGDGSTEEANDGRHWKMHMKRELYEFRCKSNKLETVLTYDPVTFFLKTCSGGDLSMKKLPRALTPELVDFYTSSWIKSGRFVTRKQFENERSSEVVFR